MSGVWVGKNTSRHLKIIILISALMLCTACSGMFFYPQEKLLRTPADIQLNYRDIYIEGEQGLLHAWWLPAESEPKGTVLFAHGNAQNISTHIAAVYWLPSQGFNVMIFDYRGYGSSAGSPSPSGLIKDAQALIRHLQQLEVVQQQGMVIYGHSLGASVIISATSRMQDKRYINGVIAEAAFSSYSSIAKDKMSQFWLTALFKWSAGLLLMNTPKPVEEISKLSGVPVLIAHSRDDEVIPFEHAEELFAAAGKPKRFWEIEGKRHNHGMMDLRDRQRLLDELILMQQEKAGLAMQATPVSAE